MCKEVEGVMTYTEVPSIKMADCQISHITTFSRLNSRMDDHLLSLTIMSGEKTEMDQFPVWWLPDTNRCHSHVKNIKVSASAYTVLLKRRNKLAHM